MNKKLISVVLPIFNADLTLSQCLDSILAQTYSDYELVAVNDGSTDKSLDILKAYQEKDSRIKILNFKKNLGIVNALNEGVKHSKGYYIARMDADDIMRKERLELQFNYIKDNPEIDLLGSLVNLFKDQGELTAGQKKYSNWSNSLTKNKEIRQEIFIESPVIHPTFFLRKELYYELGFYLDNPWAEDYDFLLRVFDSGKKIDKIPQVLLDRRDSPTRLSHIDKRCKRKAMFAAKAHYFKKGYKHLNKEKVVIIGSGNSGRHVKKAFEIEGIKTDEFLDHNDGGLNRKILGVPAFYFDEDHPDRYFSTRKNCFFILCVGDEVAREKLESILIYNNFEIEKDYLRFI